MTETSSASSSEYGSEANSADVRGDESASVRGGSYDGGEDAEETLSPELIAADAAYPTGSVKGIVGYAKLDGIGRGATTYLVRTKKVTIGRQGAGADYQLRSDSRTVSRLHATIHWVGDSDTWAISCHSQRNALTVDGAPVIADSPPMPLRSRVLIEMGDASFFFLAAVEPLCRTGDAAALEDAIDGLRAARKAKEEADEAAKVRRNAAPVWTAPPKPASGNRRSRRENESDDEYGDEEVAQIDAGFEGEDEDACDDDDDDVALVAGKRSSSHRGSKKRKRSLSGDDEDEEARRKRRKERKKKKKKKEKRKKRRLEASQSRRAHDGETEDDDEQVEMTEETNGHGRSASRGWNKARNPAYDLEGVNVEWNKKERADFCRAIFAVDVNKVFDQDGNLVAYDWTRFRNIAKLEKKTDAMVTGFYNRLMADMEGLLEDEAREKRTKGPRTKHKPGCDCVVCENTRKSRRKKQAAGGDVSDDGNADEAKESADAAEVEPTPRPERVLGLVTAQKLRVRMGIHEAARQVDSPAGQAVMQKLQSQPHSSAANGDLPEWWANGVHDHALMVGTARHGVGQWYDIWLDSHNPVFRRIRSKYGEGIEWPSTQVGMKRLREVSSAINAELRRVAKKRARRSEDAPILPKANGQSKKWASKSKASTKAKAASRSRRDDVEDGTDSDEAPADNAEVPSPAVEYSEDDDPRSYDQGHAGYADNYKGSGDGYADAEGYGDAEEEGYENADGEGGDVEGDDEQMVEVEEDGDGVEIEEEIELEMEEVDADDVEAEESSDDDGSGYT